MQRLATRWGFGALLLLSGCYRTTVTETVVERERVQLRRPADPDAPLLATTWHQEPGALVATVTPQTCEAHRSWTTLHTRTTTEKPVRSLAWAGFGIAAALDVAAALALDRRTRYQCANGTYTVTEDGQMLGYDCHLMERDNTLSVVLLGASLPFWLVAGLTAGSSEKQRTEQLSSERHEEAEEESCLDVSDRTGSLLVVRGPGGVWPVHWRTARELAISLPQNPSVPRGVELELVVFRSRPESADLWKKGTVVAKFTLPPH